MKFTINDLVYWETGRGLPFIGEVVGVSCGKDGFHYDVAIIDSMGRLTKRFLQLSIHESWLELYEM